MRDTRDEMVALLRQIAENTGAVATDGVDKTINLNGQTADQRVGFIPANSFVTLETDDLDNADPNGTITLSPGDTKAVVEYSGACAVYAVGCSDKQDVEYQLEVDGRVVGGRMNSPLGLLNEPFSFVEKLGGAVPVEKRVRYVVNYDSAASGDISLAGRLMVEVM